MIALIENSRSDLSELCQKFGVERFYVFGSAVSGQFNPNASDLDFLVRMGDRRPTGDYADRYLGLASALEQLFARRVDLVTEQSLRNPYFRRDVEASQRLVYEHPREQAAL